MSSRDVIEASARLAKIKADQLFPDLLTDDQMQAIHDRRLKKAKKSGIKISSKTFVDIKDDDYILPNGGFDDNGRPVADFDIQKYMYDMEDPETGTIHDLKIDLRDLPLSKNYYDFAFNHSGRKVNPPWSRQLWIGAMLFGEVCPVCSDKPWLDIHNVPKDYPSIDLPNHLRFLEKGKCPKCKRTKWDLIQNHGLNNYIQLVNVLGQRCVTRDTLILTSDGLEYIGDLSKGRNKGFSPFRKPVNNGREMESTSEFYVSPSKEYVHKVELKYGGSIKGTSDHPLMTSKGFKRIENLEVGDYVAVATDTQTWGSNIPSFEDAWNYADSYCKSLIRGKIRLTRIKRKTGMATPDWCKMLGLWVAEGRGGGITNWDPEVNTFLAEEFDRTFNQHDWVNDNKKAVRISGLRGHKFLEYFLGQDLKSGSAKKSIPTCILRAPKEYVCAFLQGLYEGDGGMEGRYITYCTISRKLAHELRVVLLNLGIAARLGSGWTWATNGSENQVSKRCWTLTIAGTTDLQRFQAQIGFITTRKRDALQKAVDFSSKHRKVNSIFIRDKLPTHLNKELKDFVANCVEALKEIPLPLEFDGKSGMTRKSGKERTVRNKISIGRLTLLHRHPYYWLEKGHDTRRKKSYYSGGYEGLSRIGVDVNLNKRFLKLVLDQISLFDAYLPQKLLSEKEYLRTFVDDKIIWQRVIEIARNHQIAETYDLTLPNTHRFVGNGIVNHNSGKSSSLSAQYAPYLTHRHIKFPSFASLSRTMQSSTQLTGTFVSLSFAKSIGVMWSPFRKSVMEENEWFGGLFKLLDSYKQKYGKEFYRSSSMYMDFYFKNIRIYPSGPRSTTLRGDTRIFAALDELGLFPLPKGNEEEDENSERANADEAHKSLFNSLGTVNHAYNELLAKGYNSAPPAILFNVSSPISQRDKMMRLLRESRTEEGSKFLLGVNLPTWEMNPTMTKKTPLIASAYASNAEKAERDWGANPPAVHSRFMQPDLYRDNTFVGGQNSHNFIYQFDQPGEIYGKVEKIRSFPWPSVIAIDAGHVNNSFSIAAGHYNFDSGKTVVTTLLECMPQDRRINFNFIYKCVILAIAKDLNAVALLADQWQGVDLLYRIKEDMGNNPLQKPRCRSKQYSLKRRDFNAMISMFSAKNIILPTVNEGIKQHILDGQVDNYRSEMVGKPIEHLLLQLCTVRDVGELRCPEKGEGFTDDIFRALTLLIAGIHQPNVMDRLSEARTFTYGDSGRLTMPAPASIGRSGRGLQRFTGLR